MHSRKEFLEIKKYVPEKTFRKPKMHFEKNFLEVENKF